MKTSVASFSVLTVPRHPSLDPGHCGVGTVPFPCLQHSPQSSSLLRTCHQPWTLAADGPLPGKRVPPFPVRPGPAQSPLCQLLGTCHITGLQIFKTHVTVLIPPQQVATYRLPPRASRICSQEYIVT